MKQWELVLEKSLLPGRKYISRRKYVPAKRSFSKTSDKLSYLYIGNNFQHLRQMITGFDSSYRADNFKSAIEFLSNAYTGSFPDVILFDGTHDEREINSFLNKVHKEYGSNNIIAVAEATGCSQRQVNSIRHSKLIDDLISLDTPGEALKWKVKFLKATRSEQHPALLRQKLQTGVQRKNISFSFSKRLFELIISVALLTLLLPVLLLIALAIRLESKGPILYSAPRAGRGYRIFKFYKFRTMVVNADKKVQELSHLNQYNGTDKGPVFFKATNDPRITRVGAFLRNTSLDELLQLLNVILGDMSFVGNRPLPLYEAATLTTDEYAARFMAPAGITGLWQIKKRGSSNMSIEERINLDIDYAQKNSFAYDWWIIANTPTAMLQKVSV